MNRKDEHIQYALSQGVKCNDFDQIRFVHNALPNISLDEVDITTRIGKHDFTVPIYINAMTGGTKQALELNDALSRIAESCNIAMASGSLSIALKEESVMDTFLVIRKNNPHGFIMANLGADKNIKDARKAIALLGANALQLHLNAAQEIIMPEGDRDFSSWEKNVKEICEMSLVDVIVKEVGFGMCVETMRRLRGLGVKIIDVSGNGGTNFAQVENSRRKISVDYLDSWGLSTVESLLEARSVENVEILASGGIRNPLDAVKALALGAKAVGMASWFLKLVKENTVEDAVIKTNQFILEIKQIMTLLGARNLRELRTKPIVLSNELRNYCIQRNIKI